MYLTEAQFNSALFKNARLSRYKCVLLFLFSEQIWWQDRLKKEKEKKESDEKAKAPAKGQPAAGRGAPARGRGVTTRGAPARGAPAKGAPARGAARGASTGRAKVTKLVCKI